VRADGPGNSTLDDADDSTVMILDSTVMILNSTVMIKARNGDANKGLYIDSLCAIGFIRAVFLEPEV
jgi:hypothetical protein